MVAGRWAVFAPDEVKVFAIVGEVLFGYGVGATIPTLLGQALFVAAAVEANLQIRAAPIAGLRASWRTGKLVLGSAFPAMSRQCHEI